MTQEEKHYIGLGLNNTECYHCGHIQNFSPRDILIEKNKDGNRFCYLLCKNCGKKLFFDRLEKFIEPKFDKSGYSGQVVKSKINPNRKYEIRGLSTYAGIYYLTNDGSHIYLIDQEDWELCNEKERKEFLDNLWPMTF